MQQLRRYWPMRFSRNLWYAEEKWLTKSSVRNRQWTHLFPGCFIGSSWIENKRSSRGGAKHSLCYEKGLRNKIKTWNSTLASPAITGFTLWFNISRRRWTFALFPLLCSGIPNRGSASNLLVYRQPLSYSYFNDLVKPDVLDCVELNAQNPIPLLESIYRAA